MRYARNLFKLMAYKDEYEVARLSLDPALDETVAAQFGARARYYYRLHPPVLRSLGMKKKVTLGPWFRPAFRAAVRQPPACAAPRWTCSAAPRYAAPSGCCPASTTTPSRARSPACRPAHLPAVVALAELPDMVRGYEDVKLGNVARYREALASALGDIELS